MSPKSREPQAGKAGRPASEMSRDERRKAALKANMARRKAQARARLEATGTQDAVGGTEPDHEDE